MHDYKSLHVHATVVICAILVNTQTDRHIQSLWMVLYYKLSQMN